MWQILHSFPYVPRGAAAAAAMLRMLTRRAHWAVAGAGRQEAAGAGAQTCKRCLTIFDILTMLCNNQKRHLLMLSHIKNLLLRRVSQVFEPQIATNLASKTNGLFTKDPQNCPLTHRWQLLQKSTPQFQVETLLTPIYSVFSKYLLYSIVKHRLHVCRS